MRSKQWLVGLLLLLCCSGLALPLDGISLKEEAKRLELLLKEQKIDYVKLWRQHENLRSIYNSLKLSSSKISADLKRVEEELKISEKRLQSKMNSLIALEKELARVKRLLEESRVETKNVSNQFDEYKKQQLWEKIKIGGLCFLAGLFGGAFAYGIAAH